MSLFDQAPVDLAVGGTEEFVTLALFVVGTVVGTVYALIGRHGQELAFRLLVLVGSVVCIFFEPALDHAGGIWYAAHGHNISLPAMWGVKVGVHMVLAYYIFLGVVTLIVVDRLRAGINGRGLWRMYAVVLVLAIVLELPVLFLTDVYTYYGDSQPFFSRHYWPLPLWYPVVNATLPFAMAAVVMLPLSTRRRWHVPLLPVLMPTGLFAIYFAEAWPVLTALNSDVPRGVTYFGATVTMGLALFCMHLLGLGLPRLADAIGGAQVSDFPVAAGESVEGATARP